MNEKDKQQISESIIEQMSESEADLKRSKNGQTGRT